MFISVKAKANYRAFIILLLASDQWKPRQQLKGFLLLGGNQACKAAIVTAKVTAPPTGYILERPVKKLLFIKERF